MEGSAATNLPYKIQVSLNPKYRSLIVRGRLIHEQTSRSTFPEKRKAGDSNLDLWLDGRIYPVDPSTGKQPRFHDVKSILEFVGDGENGMLGYTCSLQNSNTEISRRVVVDRERSDTEIAALKKSLEVLQQREQQLKCRQLVESESLQRQIQGLQDQNVATERSSNTMIASLKEEIRTVTKELEESIEAEVERESEIERIEREQAEKIRNLVESHRSGLARVKRDFDQTSKALAVLERKWQKVQSTPYGYKKQSRARRDLHNLSQSGGHAKAQRRLARSIVAPATVRAVQEGNAANRTKQRLCGSMETQLESGKVFGSIMSKTEVSTMLQMPSMESVGTDITNQYLNKIGAEIGAHEILAVEDRSGITNEAYSEIYKKFVEGVKSAGKGIRIGCLLPKPYHVSLLRKEMNAKLADFVGEYYPIINTLQIAPAPRSKKKESMLIELNEHNSLFVDVETVQRTMVQLYKLTPAELAGKPLIFVIKLDEAEIVHSQKLERISITIMNRALNRDITVNRPEYIAVQSEREIWPIGCFQVQKESHEVLSWVFSQTKIPALIAAQDNGQLLSVTGIGDFKVEWHLSADMKTIKCMYGLSHGACSQYNCIYCSQPHAKPTIGNEQQALAAFGKKSSGWGGGLFCSKIASKPVTGAAALGRWKPVLPIPMDRVHMCTLHAFNRIVEKIVGLHFQFIWTLRDKELQKKAVFDMQKVLSSTGAHGGNVIIFTDGKTSGKSNDVPCKPSFNGAHAAKLFNASTLPGGSEKLYTDVVAAERNFIDSGVSKIRKLEVWQGLEKLKVYFTGLTLTDKEIADFKSDVEAWGRSYVAAFGEHDVTHYIHIFVKHASWFVNKYGSLSVWSCQGMEYSHYAAKAAYNKHTQHGGGRSKKSPLVQTYQHWYRIIQHRFREIEKTDQLQYENNTFENSQAGIDIETRIWIRREAATNSSAKAHAALWRDKCDRVGSKYVPKSQESQASASMSSINN